jgi:hypothetical protein
MNQIREPMFNCIKKMLIVAAVTVQGASDLIIVVSVVTVTSVTLLGGYL